MFAYFINLFWIVISILLTVLLVLFVALFVLLATYISIKESMEHDNAPVAKLTFDGPSRFEMIRTTSRLMKRNKTTRKYRRPYFQNHVA